MLTDHEVVRGSNSVAYDDGNLGNGAAADGCHHARLTLEPVALNHCNTHIPGTKLSNFYQQCLKTLEMVTVDLEIHSEKESKLLTALACFY